MHDFITPVHRRGTGSGKYEYMLAKRADVPEDVVPLSVADMEFRPASKITEGLSQYLSDCVLGYSTATDSFREAVISWMSRMHSTDIKKDWIVNTPGVVNALYAAVNAFTKKGDGVIIMDPVYPPFALAVTENERVIEHCPMNEKDMYYTINFELFEELAKKPENKLLIFCSPANPVGRVWKREELERLVKICEDNDLYVVCDEIWSDFALFGSEHISLLRVSEKLRSKLVTCTAPSKTFNIAGLCTSNIIISDEETRAKFSAAVMKMKSYSINALGYVACKIAYNECEDWARELMSIIETNIEYTVSFITERLPMLRVRRAEGTFVVWVDCRALGMEAKALEEYLADNYVFCSQGYTFGIGGEGFLRLNIGLPTEQLKKELERFASAIEKLNS